MTFGLVQAFAFLSDRQQVQFPAYESDTAVETPNIANAARAPPTIGQNVTITGIHIHESYNACALDGARMLWTSLSFGADLDATNRTGQLFDNPSQAVTSRVDELLDQIPANSRGRITMGVGVAEDAAGNRIVLVSTSEANGYLRSGVTLRPGEVLVSGPRGSHAEMDIVRYAQENNLNLVGVGATRPVCTGCQVGIPDGVDIYTPLR